MKLGSALRKLRSTFSKKAVAIAAVLTVGIAISGAAIGIQSVRADNRDCEPNAVMYCGAFNTAELKQKYDSNASTRAIFAAAPFGISSSAFNSSLGSLQSGDVYKNGNIVVGNRVVATNAITAGRRNIQPGSTRMNIPGVEAYTRTPSVSFKQSKLQAFVKLDSAGKFQFAIIKACGNPVTGKPTTPPTPKKPNFTIQKKVRIAGSNSEWKEDVAVTPGQKVEYVIAVQNTGNVQLTGVKVRDALPAGMSYVNNSTYMVNSWDGRHGLPNGIVSSAGIGIGRIPAGGTVFVFFQATAPKADYKGLKMCKDGKTILKNRAYAKPIELPEKTDDANINTCIPSKPDFTMVKKVKKANTDDLFVDSVTVDPGTRLEYVIGVTNTGNVDIKDVLVKDILPQGVTYIPGSASMVVSGTPGRQTVPDSLVTTGFKIPVLKKGGTAFIFFNADMPKAENPIVKECEEGKTKLTNKAHVDPVGPLGPKEDTADALTCKERERKPGFKIEKDVRKKGDSDWKQDVTVKYNDSVEYKITVTNTGETDLKNVVVKDARPAGVDYVAGSLKVNGQSSNQDLFGNGVTIAEIKVGGKAEITFEAKVAAVKPDLCKDKSFRNIASAKPEGLEVKEDDAIVKAECEPFNPKVDIEKRASKAVVDVNGEFTYTLDVTNTGDVDLTNVKVTDPAPEGVQFISSNTPDGTTVNVSANNFEATIAKLAKGQKVSFEIKSKVTKELPSGAKNTACVDAPEIPGNPDDCDTVIIKTPKYECRSLNALSLGELKYRFTTLVNKSETVELTSITYNFGDGSEEVTQNNQDSVEHQYAEVEEDTTYTATAVVKFSIGGEVRESRCETPVELTAVPDEKCPYNPNLPKDSPDCVEPCPYDENLPKDSADCKPPETPEEPEEPPVTIVPNTGTTGILAGLLGTSATAYLAYAWLESRRALRNIK